MANGLMTFEFDGLPIRTLTRYGNPWFVAKDVAEVLGYSNPQKAIRDHCKRYEPVGVNDSFTPLDPQTLVIPEPDIYRLVLRSKLPAAERFETWLVEEVLPQIRQTGSYGGAVVQLTELQILQRTVDHMVEQERRMTLIEAKADTAVAKVEETAQQTETLRHRMDSLDGTNIEGTPRQRLGKMVNLYSFRNGINYRSGWGDFVKAYNTAYRTNLTARIQNFTKANKLKKEPTIPEYLETAGEIEDALRVADKMLNQQRVG